ncbi:MAG: response regulator transcription factor [Caulobacterales bacterium]
MNVDKVWGRPIMVVEDDFLIGELLVLRLEMAGYRVTWARDGAAALNMIDRAKPELLVLDLGLPVLDGFQVLERLRARPLWSQLPILVLTARQCEDDVRRAVRLGATDYMAKPFNDFVLIKRIARHLCGAAIDPKPPEVAAPREVWFVD